MTRVVLTINQAAEKLGLSVQTLYKWRSERKDMPQGFTIGNRVRFYEDVVDAWIEKRSNAEAVAA